MQLLFFFLLVGVVPRLQSAVIYRTGSGSHASLGRSRHTRVSKKIQQGSQENTRNLPRIHDSSLVTLSSKLARTKNQPMRSSIFEFSISSCFTLKCPQSNKEITTCDLRCDLSNQSSCFCARFHFSLPIVDNA